MQVRQCLSSLHRRHPPRRSALPGGDRTGVCHDRGLPAALALGPGQRPRFPGDAALQHVPHGQPDRPHAGGWFEWGIVWTGRFHPCIPHSSPHPHPTSPGSAAWRGHLCLHGLHDHLHLGGHELVRLVLPVLARLPSHSCMYEAGFGAWAPDEDLYLSRELAQLNISCTPLITASLICISHTLTTLQRRWSCRPSCRSTPFC